MCVGAEEEVSGGEVTKASVSVVVVDSESDVPSFVVDSPSPVPSSSSSRQPSKVQMLPDSRLQ